MKQDEEKPQKASRMASSGGRHSKTVETQVQYGDTQQAAATSTETNSSTGKHSKTVPPIGAGAADSFTRTKRTNDQGKHTDAQRRTNTALMRNLSIVSLLVLIGAGVVWNYSQHKGSSATIGPSSQILENPTAPRAQTQNTQTPTPPMTVPPTTVAPNTASESNQPWSAKPTEAQTNPQNTSSKLNTDSNATTSREPSSLMLKAILTLEALHTPGKPYTSINPGDQKQAGGSLAGQWRKTGKDTWTTQIDGTERSIRIWQAEIDTRQTTEACTIATQWLAQNAQLLHTQNTSATSCTQAVGQVRLAPANTTMSSSYSVHYQNQSITGLHWATSGTAISGQNGKTILRIVAEATRPIARDAPQNTQTHTLQHHKTSKNNTQLYADETIFKPTQPNEKTHDRTAPQTRKKQAKEIPVPLMG